ncbi:MAG TPA: penicillin-binding protein 2 [Terriglobia bacterium]|nr:penicillin-binding protein 2 [Terriglobia bacterium]
MELKEFYADKRFVQARIPLVLASALIAFLLLFFGLWNLQILKKGYYGELAEKNRIRPIVLVAPRGKILDRNGQIIVDNRPSFVLSLSQENLPIVEKSLPLLASGLKLEMSFLESQIQKYRQQPSYIPIVIKEDMTIEDISFIEAHRSEFPGLDMIPQPRRFYREGEMAAHLLGYVGEISEKQLSSTEFSYSKAGDLIGKAGVERTYNRILTGVDGEKKVVVDSRGREVATLESVDPVPGNDLRLTIDLDIQRAAENAFGDSSGAAIALDPRTGEVLALVSRPAYDPNRFSSRISRSDWDELINDPSKPMQNRAIQSRFPPGSVFKVFMTIAGLQEGILTPDYTDYCTGTTVIYGHLFHCHKKEGHGRVDLHKAIVNSCNVFFYHVGQKLGIDRISYYAHGMGLGLKTGVDLPSEDSGLVPSSEWKRKTYKTDWYAGETISVAIGQGYVALTPIQTARAFAGLAMGGQFRTPHVVSPEELKRWGRAVNVSYESSFPLNEETVDIVTQGLWGVVNEGGGTGHRAAIQGFDVCGKTGTAQVIAKDKTVSAGAKSEFEDNAWFVGFAPRGAPEIAAAAFVEHGGHGGVAAAPIVHDIFMAHYAKRMRTKEGPQLAMKQALSTAVP